MALNRSDFNNLLSDIKSVLVEQSVTRGYVMSKGIISDGNRREVAQFIDKRRISGFNQFGHLCPIRIGRLLRRLGKFTCESMWNSMYSKMYRTMTLDSKKMAEYGDITKKYITETVHRTSAVNFIRATAQVHKYSLLPIYSYSS